MDDQTITAIGEVLGQHFTQEQLQELCELLSDAGEACSYAADDLAERADFERKHDGSEEDEYSEAADGYSATIETIGKLCQAIERGEVLGRDDH